MDVQFVKRKRGNVLLCDGRQYHKLRTYKNGNTIYICSRIKKDRCRGTITLDEKRVMVKFVDHSCKADIAKNEIAIAVNQMRENAERTDVPIPKLHKEFANSMKDKGLDKVTSIPGLSKVKTALYSCRNRSCFQSAEEVIIPIQHKSFLLSDFSTRRIRNDKFCRILVFCSEEGRKLLTQSKEFFGDGTFYSCPSPFEQLYTIHGDLSESTSSTNVKPMVYALMTDKSEESYKALFGMIKSQIPDWSPNKFHADFEISATNAIKYIFPHIDIKHCYYHYSNSHWKKAKKLKLSNKREKRIVGLCTALPLLPITKIHEGWSYITAESSNNQKIDNYLKYVRNTWIKNDAFMLEWCVFGERHRTNNAVESWNAKLNKETKKRQPITILRLLNVLIEIESDMIEFSHRRQEQIQNDDFIISCQLQLLHNEITVGHFLDKLR